MLNGDSRRSKSFEEREEEYEKARRRIFNREHSVSFSGFQMISPFHFTSGKEHCNIWEIIDQILIFCRTFLSDRFLD